MYETFVNVMETAELIRGYIKNVWGKPLDGIKLEIP